jgi:hypothetical protein
MLDWFLKHASLGNLEIGYSSDTWRSNQVIASFSDSVHDPTLGFPPTVSMSESSTGHDGVFVVSPDHATEYVGLHEPLCLRSARNIAQDVDLPFRTFGTVKGLTVDRVLIYPTAPIIKFLKSGTPLKPKPSCGLYVAITRARHSVAFVVDDPDSVDLPRWKPTSPT